MNDRFSNVKSYNTFGAPVTAAVVGTFRVLSGGRNIINVQAPEVDITIGFETSVDGGSTWAKANVVVGGNAASAAETTYQLNSNNNVVKAGGSLAFPVLIPQGTTHLRVQAGGGGPVVIGVDGNGLSYQAG